MIRYFSTRDSSKTGVTFEEALLKGLAPDGGLYVPDAIPSIDPSSWQRASTINDIGLDVLNAWLGHEVPPETLERIVHDALNFPVPVKRLSDTLWILELFHGPTLSFKDFGARTMARLMQHFLTKRGERRTILVATSGDTGSAVADGFAGMDSIEVVLLYPHAKVSEVQERQLIAKRDGVRSYAVKGTFDDCQRMVKEAFVHPALAHLPLSSANSINIGRLLPQSLYYLWAASQTGLSELNFAVPSGNLGNLTGGVLAAKMGLDVHTFIAAHNANDFFPNYLEKLVKPYDFRPTVATVSNAMDVGAPSNFERLYNLIDEASLQRWVWGLSTDNETTLKRMTQVYEAFGYLSCPHTAVGLEAVERYRKETGDNTPVVSLACAHPAKFPQAVKETTGQVVQVDALEVLKSGESRVDYLQPTTEALAEVLNA